jgi:hypothetical protein
MSHPLDDAETRCKWAHHRLDLLQEEISASPAKDQTLRFRQEFDPDTNTITLLVDSEIDFPVEWALTVSEILYNCRVALDYVAWELRNRQQEMEGKADVEDLVTMFIVDQTPEKFAAHQWHLKFIDPAHVAIIEELQPYAALGVQQHRAAMTEQMAYFIEHGTVDWEAIDSLAASSHPLAILSALNAKDKHKILNRVHLQASDISIGPFDEVDCEVLGINIVMDPRNIRKDAKWLELTVRPTGPNPEVKMPSEVKVGVSFGGYQIEGFQGIIAGVLRVIETFKPLL